MIKGSLLFEHIQALTKFDIKIEKSDLPIFYWTPKLHKSPYESSFISNSSHCPTIILSKHITSTLTYVYVKDHVFNHRETAFSNNNANFFWSIKTPEKSSKSSHSVTSKFAIIIFLVFLLHALLYRTVL